jgi:hypothetical protein
MKIIVEKRSDDFIAYIEGHKELWECGKYRSVAIGNLIITHPDKFGIEIKWDNQ